jgi:hypothetical protein
MFAFRLLALSARILLALGLCCGLLGLYLANEAQTFLQSSVRASGEVVSYREIRDGDDTRYRPRVRFETANGSIVAFEGQLATTTTRFTIGEKIPVVYDAANPQKARVALFTDNWLGATVALAIGALCFVGGLFIRRASKKAAGLPS